MLQITKLSPNRIDIELSGTLDAETMRDGIESLLTETQDITKGQMLYRIVDFNMPTISAIGVELRYLPKLFSLLSKFDRCAVLCDKSWIRTAAEIEGALIPGLSIKSFELDEKDAAEAWLNDDS